MCLGFPFFKTKSIDIKGKAKTQEATNICRERELGGEMEGEKPPH